MTPLVIVELLPNDPNIKKEYNRRFVPLPIADNQVPSNILIIQLFNCYTSETNKYICHQRSQVSITNDDFLDNEK